MPYPEEFEGFMVQEIGKYQDLKKQSVRVSPPSPPPKRNNTAD
jgi:hypothetical protein